MDAQWVVISAVVRLIFLVAPFLQAAGEFALSGANLEEAKEMSNAANCKAMLASLPVMFLLAIMIESDRLHPCGISPLYATLSYLTAFALTFACVHLPARLYRGSVMPFMWFTVITGIDALLQLFALAPIVATLCGCCRSTLA